LYTKLRGERCLTHVGTEGRCDEAAVAAWLVAPPEAFAERYRQVGLNLTALSDAFSVTETCAAIRIPEAGGPGASIITPTRVYCRGSMAWLGEEDARRIARHSHPRSVRKVAVRDEPGRVALVSRGG
ncbi:MAG: hypothetical protein WKG00_03130, partial [Polyangiaceae bacterium]